MKFRWLAMPLAILAGATGPSQGSEVRMAPQVGTIHVTVTDLRSAKGEVHACLAPNKMSFPDCESGQGRTLTLPASQRLEFDFANVPQGRYAIALLHDENANGKIDKALMIPREGFGFSRDAPVRMGPPSFKDAAFDVNAKGVNQSIRMRYII